MNRICARAALGFALTFLFLPGAGCTRSPSAVDRSSSPKGVERASGSASARAVASGSSSAVGSADNVRDLHLQGVMNARDLGGLPGQRAAVPSDRFLRSADLSKATEADKATLLRHDVKLDLDLRTPDEVAKAPDALAQDPRFRYVNISLFGAAPLQVHGVKSLSEMYIRALAEDGAEFKAVFEELAGQPDGAVLYHCSAGKDRTGIVSAMLLALAGVERSVILQNYALSTQYLGPLIDAYLKKDPSLAPLLGTPPEEMARFLDTIDAKYGGVRSYLRQVGVRDAALDALVARLGQ